MLDFRRGEDAHSLLSTSPKLNEKARGDANGSLMNSNSSFGDLLSSLPRPRFHGVSGRSVVDALCRLAAALLPSFVHSRWKGRQAHPQQQQHHTAYLDGLRGVAALFVFWCHMSYVVFPLGDGYGSGEGGGNRHFMLLPFIRLVFGGSSMVSIFFVISGYALSVKPLRQMRSGAHEELFHTMSSAVLRRGFRLYLPCIASTLFVALLCQLGIYQYTASTVEDKNLLRNYNEFHQPTFANPFAQLRDWLQVFLSFLDGGAQGYDHHLWTITYEFRQSMGLFLAHYAVARLRTPLRLLAIAVWTLWCARFGRWAMILFYIGMLLAEVDLIRATRSYPNHELSQGALQTPDSKKKDRYWTAFWMANLVCGMYLCSCPEKKAERTYGFMTMSEWAPSSWGPPSKFWQSCGAAQICFAITSERKLQRFFSLPSIHYLGKISFAMYLMHGPVLHSFGYAIMPFWWGITGTAPWGFELGFFLVACCNTVVLIWAADIFWRFVDTPSIKFTRWLELKCI